MNEEYGIYSQECIDKIFGLTEKMDANSKLDAVSKLNAVKETKGKLLKLIDILNGLEQTFNNGKTSLTETNSESNQPQSVDIIAFSRVQDRV